MNLAEILAETAWFITLDAFWSLYLRNLLSQSQFSHLSCLLPVKMAKKKKVTALFTHHLITNPFLIAHSCDFRALPMVLTHPVRVSVVFAKSRWSLPLEARPTGQCTHSAMPIARRKVWQRTPNFSRSFFGKGSELSIQSASTSSSTLLAPPLSNAPLSLHPNHKNNVDSSTQVTSTFFTCLCNATESLPESVPLATAADTLAQFSGDLSLGEDDEDAWQMVDQALNRIIGYGGTVDEISTLIWCGEFGIDGLCCWLEKCVSTLRIEEVLLENKVNHLVEAMVKLCILIIHYGMERSVNLNSRANTNDRPVIPSTPNQVVELPAATTQNSCPGYSVSQKVMLPWHFS